MQSSIEKRAWLVFAGLLVAACVAALAWTFGWGRGESTYELRTQEAVSGLIEGAPVEFHGVEVGSVRQVRLLDARTVQVLLRVKHDTPVTTATVATVTGRGVAARGFTGYVYVSLEDVAPSGAALAKPANEPYPRIPTAPVRFVSLDTSMSQLNDNVRTVTALLQDTLDAQTVRSLKATVANLEQVSGALASDQAKFKTVLANMERVSGNLVPLVQSGRELTQAFNNSVLPHVNETLGRMDRTAESATATLQQVDNASRELVPLVQSSNAVLRSVEAQLLPQSRQALARTNQLLIKLDDTATRIQDNPSVLVWGAGSRAQPGPGE